jgi:transcriptional regulator with XRE-family HTH domain
LRETEVKEVAASNIVFSNLRAEMARKGITIQRIADALDVNRDTAARKLSRRSPITLSDASIIRNRLFPGLSLHYLFQELVDPADE